MEISIKRYKNYELDLIASQLAMCCINKKEPEAWITRFTREKDCAFNLVGGFSSFVLAVIPGHKYKMIFAGKVSTPPKKSIFDSKLCVYDAKTSELVEIIHDPESASDEIIEKYSPSAEYLEKLETGKNEYLILLDIYE